MIPRCVYCAEPASEVDHLTARDDHGRYLHPALVWPSCPPCNKLGWRIWCAASLDRLGDRSPVAVALRRLAACFARLGDCGRPIVELPSSSCAVLASVLDEIADWIERTLP